MTVKSTQISQIYIWHSCTSVFILNGGGGVGKVRCRNKIFITIIYLKGELQAIFYHLTLGGT